MTNKEILVKSVNSWAGNILSNILPSMINLPKMNQVNNIIGSLFGFDLSSYSILNEFSFLIPDLFKGYVAKGIDSFMSTLCVSDEEIPEQVNKILTSCINRCNERGFINIYGIQFEAKAFEDLMQIFNSNINNTNVGLQSTD